MKIKFLALSFFAALSFSGYSQTKRELGSFTKVTAFDKIEVHLVRSNVNKIELSGTNSEQVELVNKDEELKVRMPLGKMLKGDEVVATIYFKQLDALEANEGSYIKSDEILKASLFDIIAKEGGKIKVTVNATKIAVKVSSGANIELAGTTQNIDAVATAGGVLEAIKCDAQQATVTVNAGGEIYITAHELVDAKARAGGNIIIHGNPKQVNQKTVMGGNIIVKKD